MAKAERIAMTDQERAERRKHEQELTERAVAQLRCSAGWQRWLTVRARAGLRRLSVRNQLLVCLQDPTATYVAGFRAWLKLGYCVRRGSTSHIRIWAPCPPSRKKLQAWRDAGAAAAERPRTYFRLEAVFSQAQVEPLPPPAQPAPLEPPSAELQGDSLAWAQAPLEQLADELGYRVVAHVRHDRQPDDPTLGYAEEELVAESVAHLAVSSVGLDSSVAAVPYLAGWAEAAAPDTFERIAELVDRLARRLEAALGAEQATRPTDDNPNSTAARAAEKAAA